MESRTCANYLIVGGGIAGVSCAEMLAINCPNESILLISASPTVKAVTNISNLTKLITTFNIKEETAEEFASKHRGIQVVTLKANDYVQYIDHNRREVITESKMRFSYDKLCLCHGARPKLITPYFKTDVSKYVIGIRDTESVATFQEKLKTSKRICIVGNGGIATEMVYELQAVDIVWAIKDDSIATTFFDPGAAEFFISDFYEKSVHNDEHRKAITEKKNKSRGYSKRGTILENRHRNQ